MFQTLSGETHAGAGSSQRIGHEVPENLWHLAEIERLVEKEVRSGLQAFLPVLGVRKIAENDYSDVGAAALDGPKDVDSASVSHLKVQNYDIRSQLLDGMGCFLRRDGISDQFQSPNALQNISQTLNHRTGAVRDEDR